MRVLFLIKNFMGTGIERGVEVCEKHPGVAKYACAECKVTHPETMPDAAGGQTKGGKHEIVVPEEEEIKLDDVT